MLGMVSVPCPVPPSLPDPALPLCLLSSLPSFLILPPLKSLIQSQDSFEHPPHGYRESYQIVLTTPLVHIISPSHC